MAQTRDTSGLIATTLDNYRARMNDNIFNKRFLLDWLMKHGRVTERGGNSIVEPVMLGKNNSVAFYADYDTFNVDSQAGMTRALDVWRQLGASLVISGIEEAINSGDSAILKLVEAKAMQTEESISAILSAQIVAKASGATKTFNSLVDLVGTATFMGIDPTVVGQESWVSYVEATATALTLSQISTAINSIGLGSGNRNPDIGITTSPLWVKFEALLLPNERFVNTETAMAGFQNIGYRGVTVSWDPDVATGVVYILSSPTLELVTFEGNWLKRRAAVLPTNQDASIQLYTSYGNLITNNRRNQGKLTAKT